MIAGNLPPTSGSIHLDGKRIDGQRPEQVSRRGVARTFQIVRPFPGMTVLENVMIGALFGRGRTLSQRTAATQAHALIEDVGLGPHSQTPAAELTLAGRKRLEIARALATQPSLLLLDEVLAGLNATEVAEALALLQRLHESRGLSIIIVEHVMRALMRLSHRIVVLHDGRKIMEGTPDAVANDPRVIKAYLGEPRETQLA
jgi:branched-chain amino acid transport system ATP-binding protein